MTEYRANTPGRRLLEAAGRGGATTFALHLGLGMLVAACLSLTVLRRPADELMPAGTRVRHSIVFWVEHGFLRHAGLNFSEPPATNPRAMVYSSSPHAERYPLYLLNAINHRLRGASFGYRLFRAYHHAALLLAAALLGYLGTRLALRTGAPPLQALACAMTGQILFHTFPPMLTEFFGLFPKFVPLLGLLLLLLAEERGFEADGARWASHLRSAAVFLAVYGDKSFGVPGVAGYLAAKALLGGLPARELRRTGVALAGGLGLHLAQLAWVKLRFPEVKLAGATFLWRSGLDGATNHVGALTAASLGKDSVPLSWLGAVATLAVLGFFLGRGRRELSLPLLLVMTAVGFYLLPGFLFGQWALIHPYLHDLFLAVAAVLALCFVLVPHLEARTGRTGALVWCLAVLGFCVAMYQLRVFAIAHPLLVPEPDWRSYLGLG